MIGRFEGVSFDAIRQAQHERATLLCTAVEQLVEEIGPSRSASLALTKLEEAHVWIGKALRDAQAQANQESPPE